MSQPIICKALQPLFSGRVDLTVGHRYRGIVEQWDQDIGILGQRTKSRTKVDRREKIGSRQRKDKVKVSCRAVQTLKVQNGIRVGILQSCLMHCKPVYHWECILINSCLYFARGHYCLDFVSISLFYCLVEPNMFRCSLSECRSSTELNRVKWG